VFGNRKSSYIFTDLFLKWLEEDFIARKYLDKALLTLRDYSAHLNNLDMLEFAETNQVILL
jgi:hypothetical protein